MDEEKITRTGEGIPVGTSPEEEQLEKLHREGRLPEDARRKGLPGDEEDEKEGATGPRGTP